MLMAAAQGAAALPNEAVLDAAACQHAAARALPAAQPGLPGDMRGRMLALHLHLLGHLLPAPSVRPFAYCAVSGTLLKYQISNSPCA